MKHLKKFESTDIISGYMDIKKYVVWEMTNNLIILEVTSIDTDTVHMKRLYIYHVEYNKLRVASEETYTMSYDTIKEHVVYDSDNLDDCLDETLLAAIKNTSKYNL